MIKSRSDKFVVIIYTSLPGYMFNCIEKLAVKSTFRIILVETDTNVNYPVKYKSMHFDILKEFEFENFLSNIRIENILKVFITGWGTKRVMRYFKYFAKNKVRMILLSDQARKYNIKQTIGRFLLRDFLKKFELVVVPGKSGYDLMHYYGVPRGKIQTGLYSSADEIFRQAKILRNSKKEWPRCFLYDGQYIKRKGVPFLISEYLKYREKSKNPWDLIMVGKGNLEDTIPPQIKNLGFIKQESLKDLYENAGCFILPSYEDHWPLVIHQATCAGLPLLISPYCGSHLEFFVNEKNGYFIDPNISGSLANKLFEIEGMEENKLREMGEFSYELSTKYSVDKWVDLFRTIINN